MATLINQSKHVYVKVKKNDNTPISFAPNFTGAQLWGGKNPKNKVGDEHRLSKTVIKAAQAVRDYFGVPVLVNSSLRDGVYNKSIGGASNSAHVYGLALDLTFETAVKKDFVKKFNTEIRDKGPLFDQLIKIGIGGFGMYGTFVHIDARNSNLGPPRKRTYTGEDGIPRKFSQWKDKSAIFLDGALPEEGTGVHRGDSGFGVLKEIPPTSEADGIWYETNPTDGSLVSLINDNKIVSQKTDIQDIYNTEVNGVTNRKRIYDSLPRKEKIALGEYDETVDYEAREGTQIFFNYENIVVPEEERGISVTNFFDYHAFSNNLIFPNELKTLSLDPGYTPLYLRKEHNVGSNDIYPRLQVYVWSRAYGEEGEFIDVTDYVIRLNTHTDNNGGNFSITLAPVTGTYDDFFERWELDEQAEGVALGNINREKEFKYLGGDRNQYIRNNFYYEKVIGQNDIVFIAFEQMEFEKGDENRKRERFLNPNQVSGRWWDMIGLVDTVGISHTAAGTDVGIQVAGRDFTKGLIDDVAYINPWALGNDSSAVNIADANDINQKLRLEEQGARNPFGLLDEIAYKPRTIKEAIELITYRIASVGYVPDEVFESWKGKTQISVASATEETWTETKGIWRITKVLLDPNIEDLKFTDQSLTNPNASIFQLFQNLAQYPFVEMITDTYTDRFYMIFRRPPIDRESIQEIAYAPFEGEPQTENIASERNSLRSYQGGVYTTRDFDSGFAPPVADFRNQDLMIPSGDIFEVTDTIYPLIINIDESDVLSDALAMDTRAFAWYEIAAFSEFQAQGSMNNFLPSIYLDEYAQIFGNKRMTVAPNYSLLLTSMNENERNNNNSYIRMIVNQLAWIIETHCYLPFTRRGTLIINGDRRIKKGNWIYYRPTDEIFYVTGVTQQMSINNNSIDRTTTIQVERGMVREYIRNGEFTYFDIVNIDKVKEKFSDLLEDFSIDGIPPDSFVNEDAFRFFLEKRQFNREYSE